MGNTHTVERPTVVIAGANGYIGRNLIKELMKNADIIALSRSTPKRQPENQQIIWRSCDLFSVIETEESLRGADYAIYLVHSMLPSARLTQGSFEDMDLILADNFAQAAEKNGVKQIVYLSGLIPDTDDLSRHLKSRLEVEKVLGSYNVPLTTLRAGLIVGPRGSSFPILVKLVKRLPIMLLPKWTNTLTHPIALQDVLHAIKQCIGNQTVFNRPIDIGGPDVMTYREMMQLTSQALGKTRYLCNIPYLTVRLSRLWVSLTTNTPKNLVYPLIESLIHPMTAQPERIVDGISLGKTPFIQAASDALQFEQQVRRDKQKAPSKIVIRISNVTKVDNVRSVQRVRIPQGKNAKWLALYYVEWLSHYVKPFIRVELDHTNNCKLFTFFGKKPLLELTFSDKKSAPNRALFYIAGGALALSKDNHRARLEFIHIPGTNECIIAIHDYIPSIPWFIYQYTQAKLHLWVMKKFKKNLNSFLG